MNSIALIALFIFAVFFGAITHEYDIAQECNRTGAATNTAWFNDITCVKTQQEASR